MSVVSIRHHIESLGGVLTLAPAPGDGTPEIAWGDFFFYYAPDGVLPNGQPFATIVTKEYPDDTSSQLSRPGFYRVNVAAGRDAFERVEPDVDPATPDVLFAHPVYAAQHWLSVVNPGVASEVALKELLAVAHGLARGRAERR